VAIFLRLHSEPDILMKSIQVIKEFRLLSLQRFVCLNHKACFGACNKVNESLLTKCRVPHNVNDSALFASIYFYSYHVCDVLICRKVKYPLAPVGWRREELN
jgi:hypothetical protein